MRESALLAVPNSAFPVSLTLERSFLFEFLQLTAMLIVVCFLCMKLLWTVLTTFFVYEHMSARERQALFWRRLLFITLMAIPLSILASAITSSETLDWSEMSSSP